MRRLISMLLGAALVLTAAGCAPKAAEQGGLKAGTYTVEVKGHNDAITMEVALSAESIDTVEVKSHKETPGVSDGAFDKVLPAIIGTSPLR